MLGSSRASRTRRLVVSSAIAAVAAAAIGAGSAAAHVGVDKDEITAGTSTVLTFSVGHGCEGSPTTSMKFQVPEGVINAQPLVKPGWDIAIDREQLATPLESAHGDPQTDRVAVITFTAIDGYAIPNDYRDTFSMSLRAPETEGELFFKVVQGCETGENPWIEEWDGTGTEPDHPAPSVKVVAGATDEAGGTATTVFAASSETTVAIGQRAAGDDGDDSDSNGLAITGLVVGALGLAAGGTALVRTRRPASPT